MLQEPKSVNHKRILLPTADGRHDEAIVFREIAVRLRTIASTIHTARGLRHKDVLVLIIYRYSLVSVTRALLRDHFRGFIRNISARPGVLRTLEFIYPWLLSLTCLHRASSTISKGTLYFFGIQRANGSPTVGSTSLPPPVPSTVGDPPCIV